MSLVTLICEGRCNPSIRELDAEVLQHKKYSELPVGSERLWQQQRRLNYTTHRLVSEQVARCTDCGHDRRFGGYGGSEQWRHRDTAEVV